MNTDELYNEINRLLSEYDIIYSLEDIENLTVEDIFQGIHNTVVSHITAPLSILGIITAIIIFSSFVRNMNESMLDKNFNMTDIISVLTAIAVTANPLLSLYSEVSETIIRCGEFINLFVPIFAGICALSGSISALGTYNATVLGISQVIIWISETYLMPALKLTTALSVTNSIYSKSFFDNFIKFMSKAVNWTLTVFTTLFVGFLTVKSTLGTAVDTFATKTAKFVISGFVPVIGSAVSDAYTTVKGSIGILKCSTGMAGIIASIMIFLPPLIEVILFRLVMKTGVAIADMFSVKPIEKLLKNLESGLSATFGIIISFILIFIVSTAILMKTGI